MSRPIAIAVNGDTFPASPGDRLLDAALKAGADIPHECRSGQCGTCLVRIVDGHVLGGRTGVPGSVLACQAVVLSDARIAVEATPPVVRVTGVVEAVTPLVPGIVEVTIATAEPFAWYAGQYASFRFDGFPERYYSPTVALDGLDRPGTFRLQVQQRADGRVSPALGTSIRPGYGVTIEGPFGSAWLRPASASRLVLMASGTGFAPIWAIADAALCQRVSRPIVVVVGARSLSQLYMAKALIRLAKCPNLTVLPITTEAQSAVPAIATGRIGDLGHIIAPGDVVHAAGSPTMVEALRLASHSAGAVFHADPFVPTGKAPRRSLGSLLAERLGRARARCIDEPLLSAPMAAGREQP